MRYKKKQLLEWIDEDFIPTDQMALAIKLSEDSLPKVEMISKIMDSLNIGGMANILAVMDVLEIEYSELIMAHIKKAKKADIIAAIVEACEYLDEKELIVDMEHDKPELYIKAI